MADLGDMVALVTGGAVRVGRAIVTELAQAGCGVAIHYRKSAEQAAALAIEVAALGVPSCCLSGELEDPDSWAELVRGTVAKLGRLDVLVNNAAAFVFGEDTVEGFDVRQWERMLRVNLVAPMGLVHHARRYLAASGRGSVVNLCDISAERPWPAHLSYCASKAGLVNVTRALARALAPEVRVNAVAPGIAEFPEYYSESLRRELIAQVPLKRPGSPEQVARAVRFLAESGDFITGQVIAVDGGRSIA
ncbi:MAG TPA: SDR family oxidoreductase [Phycisphaerae bacterium]|nr:SDR family oxidoreductase [Phycisphaerae bacterium]HNU46870.1 SDR family oxidoreductase [Phycisphaerae bacterium]